MYATIHQIAKCWRITDIEELVKLVEAKPGRYCVIKWDGEHRIHIFKISRLLVDYFEAVGKPVPVELKKDLASWRWSVAFLFALVILLVVCFAHVAFLMFAN